MAEKTDKAPRKQVATTIDTDVYAALQDIRWAERAEKLADVIRDAISEYVARHGKVETAANGK